MCNEIADKEINVPEEHPSLRFNPFGISTQISQHPSLKNIPLLSIKL